MAELNAISKGEPIFFDLRNPQLMSPS